MNCTKCGAPITDGSVFCGNCGASIQQPPQQPSYQPVQQYQQPQNHAYQQPEYQQSAFPPPQQGGEAWRQHATAQENAAVSGQRVTQNVYLGGDGKYRWVYELNFRGNRSARKTLQKTLGIVMAAGGVFVTLIWVIMSFMDSADLDALPLFLGVWVAITLGVELISFLAMAIVSAFYKGSYWTIFEMDKNRITQIQMKKTFQRTQMMALIHFLTDDNLPDMMTSIKMGTKDRYETTFDSMRSVKLDTEHDLIECNGAIALCPVYVQKEDFDFVLNYILEHVPEKTVAGFHAKYH